MPEKWLGFLVLMVAVSSVRDVRAGLVGVAVAGAVLAAARCGRMVGRVMKIAAPVALLIVPATALAVAPRAERILGIAYSGEGLRVGTVTVLRCVGLLLLAAALVGSSPAGGLFASLRRLGAPRRLVEVLWLAERFVRGVGVEGQALRRAATCRGFAPSLRPRAVCTLGTLAGAHLVRSLQRGQRVHDVMLARGYAGGLRWADLRPRAISDVALTAVFVGVAGVLISMRWWV